MKWIKLWKIESKRVFLLLNKWKSSASVVRFRFGISIWSSLPRPISKFTFTFVVPYRRRASFQSAGIVLLVAISISSPIFEPFHAPSSPFPHLTNDFQRSISTGTYLLRTAVQLWCNYGCEIVKMYLNKNKRNAPFAYGRIKN